MKKYLFSIKDYYDENMEDLHYKNVKNFLEYMQEINDYVRKSTVLE